MCRFFRCQPDSVLNILNLINQSQTFFTQLHFRGGSLMSMRMECSAVRLPFRITNQEKISLSLRCNSQLHGIGSEERKVRH